MHAYTLLQLIVSLFVSLVLIHAQGALHAVQEGSVEEFTRVSTVIDVSL